MDQKESITKNDARKFWSFIEDGGKLIPENEAKLIANLQDDFSEDTVKAVQQLLDGEKKKRN